MNLAQPADRSTRQDEIAALVETLHATDRRLDQLLCGEVDSVTNRNGDTLLLGRAQRQLRQNDASRQLALFGALPTHIAVLDPKGVIVSVNTAWRKFGKDNQLLAPGAAIGMNYLDICDRTQGVDRAEAASIAAGIRSVLHGDAAVFATEYGCHSPHERRWFQLRVTPAEGGWANGVVVMHVNITQRVEATIGALALTLRNERHESMLKTLLASISDLTTIFDRRGQLVFANQPMLDLWAMTLETAVGCDFVRLGYLPDEAVRRQAAVKQVFETGLAVKGEGWHRREPSPARHFEYIFSPALAPDGSIDYVVGCSRDITERKQASLALGESLAEFRALAAAMPQMVYATDTEGHSSYVNQQWVDYTGMGLGETLRAGLAALTHSDDRQRLKQEWDDAQEHHSSYSTEIRIRRLDGEYRWWVVRAVCVFDTAGLPAKWICTCTDVHDFKVAVDSAIHANLRLQQQQIELRTLFDLVPAMIMFKDTNNNIVRLNQLAASGMGRTVQEIEGTPIREHPGRGTEFYADDLEIIRSGLPIMSKVECSTDAHGNERWFQKDKVPYHDQDGVVIGIIVMRHDITERKRDQDALRELNANLEARVNERTGQLKAARDDAENASRAKSDFLATMSHEIRTPMGGMLGLLELLDLSALSAEQRSTLSDARDSGAALLKIINDILDFSKIEAESLDLDPVAGSVRDMVESVARLHRQVTSSKNVSLQVHVDAQVAPLLMFDPLRIGQVLNNFLSNAIKFTERGTVRLVVECIARRPDAEDLRFSVVDTGIGMTADQLDRIFKPFAQADARIGGRFGGTGLGLVISRRLAELMGGSVQIVSEHGKGTTLTLSLSLPTCAPGAPTTPARATDRSILTALVQDRRTAPCADQAEAEGTLLLIVEDHPINRALLVRQAASLGYASESAGDGLQALQAMRRRKFGAVITDCNMPNMTGYALAGAIRQNEQDSAGGRLPIIGCTANALQSAMAACVASGMDDCVVKPADLAQISRVLERWIPLAGEASPAFVATTSNAGTPEGLIDLTLLQEITGGNPQVLAQMLADFRRVNDSDADSLRRAGASLDYAQALQFSHRMKGASLMLGATLLARSCELIEAAAAAQDPVVMQRTLPAFEDQLLRLNNYLDTLAPSAPPVRPLERPVPER